MRYKSTKHSKCLRVTAVIGVPFCKAAVTNRGRAPGSPVLRSAPMARLHAAPKDFTNSKWGKKKKDQEGYDTCTSLGKTPRL